MRSKSLSGVRIVDRSLGLVIVRPAQHILRLNGILSSEIYFIKGNEDSFDVNPYTAGQIRIPPVIMTVSLICFSWSSAMVVA